MTTPTTAKTSSAATSSSKRPTGNNRPSKSPSAPDKSRGQAVLELAFDFLRNAILLAGLWFAYSLVRRVTADELTTAIGNAGHVVTFQQAIGLPNEASLQTLFVKSPGFIKALNSFYMLAHFPLTGLFMAWVFFFRRKSFPVIRESMVILTVSGLIIHVLFPLAPPRLLPGFFDTGLIFGPSPYDLEASESANKIAAMPSLHVGWALIVAISVISLLRSRWRFLALIHPIFTALVVVATANHYWMDAIVAALLVVGAWEFSARLAHHQMLERHQPRTDDPSVAEDQRQLTSSP